MTTNTDQTVYEAEFCEGRYLMIFDSADEMADAFPCTADPSRAFFDMTDEEREEYDEYDEYGLDVWKCRSVEEYEELIGRPIAPRDEWLPDVYDAALEAESWKRVSDWNERGICKVIDIAD